VSGPAEPPPRRLWKLLLGPAAAGVILLLRPGDDFHVAAMAGIAVWMAAWWVTEAVAIPVTALLPLVLIPLFGIQPVSAVAPNYSKATVYLFLGGFLLAIGLQESGVHRRIALGIVHKVGSQPRRLVLGFMLASALLSMWISNTATVMVLMPIGLAVLAAVKDRGVEKAAVGKLGVTIMLGIAYAADIGGMATPVGTPPNLVYKEQLGLLFKGAPPPSFGEWFLLGLPISVVFLFGGWLLLTRLTFKLGETALLGSREAIGEMRAELGPMRRDERVVVTVFAITALLWILRRPLEFGLFTIPGWSQLPFLRPKYVDDAVVAIAMALMLFIIPSHDRRGERLLEWRMAKQVPWGMLLLFGGGFALAAGFTASGLSDWLGRQVAALHGLPPLLVVAIVCVILTLLTELTSNTATTTMVMPVLAAAGTAMGTDPRGLMIPATLSASCAFMMPVASPTQAIVFASGWVPIRDMVRAGIWFNVLGVILVTLVFALLAGPIMGIDLSVLPPWAAAK
jgi:sodium-dependent dicarboxylate transporter 2/3/5